MLIFLFKFDLSWAPNIWSKITLSGGKLYILLLSILFILCPLFIQILFLFYFLHIFVRLHDWLYIITMYIYIKVSLYIKHWRLSLYIFCLVLKVDSRVFWRLLFFFCSIVLCHVYWSIKLIVYEIIAIVYLNPYFFSLFCGIKNETQNSINEYGREKK